MHEAKHPSFDNFVDTVAKLRSPDGGCSWNRAQTHASLGDYMIEEAYEALDAIEAGDPDHLREELGDVLLQVVLQSQIAADAGEFTIDDVCAGIDEKMIRRHPHVFGDVKAANANEVSELWEQVKLAEKKLRRCPGWRGDGDSEPARRRADAFPGAAAGAEDLAQGRGRRLRMGNPRRRVGQGGRGARRARGRLRSCAEVGRRQGCSLRRTWAERDPLVAAAEMEFGDLLFALVNVARKMGIDAESALRASNAKFRRRFAEVERGARIQGKTVEELTLDEMELLWQRAKEEE